MTKEDTDLIGDAIDFYNLNHFKGKDTKKRLVTLKKEIKALTIPVVSQQRELLIDFLDDVLMCQDEGASIVDIEKYVDGYLGK